MGNNRKILDKPVTDYVGFFCEWAYVYHIEVGDLLPSTLLNYKASHTLGHFPNILCMAIFVVFFWVHNKLYSH